MESSKNIEVGNYLLLEMTSMKTKLESLIEAALEEYLNEAMDSKASYERMKELEKGHQTDFWILEKVGPEVYQEILNLRDESKDYSDFFDKVGPGRYDSSVGFYKPTNRFGMRPEMVRAIYDKKIGALPIDELMKLKEEWEQLKDRFEKVDATNETDRVYGRKRTDVVDTRTGEVVSSTTDRPGSLGS